MIGLGLGLGLSAGFSTFAWTPALVGAALRGWYKGNAIGTDLSGIGNTLTVTGTTNGVGYNGHATTLFNGTSDTAARTSGFNFSMGGTTGLTVALVAKQVSTTTFGVMWAITPDNLSFHTLIENSGGADNVHYDSAGGTGGTEVGAGFNRYVITDDGTTATFYINGVQVGTGASIGHMGAAVNFALGDRQGGALFSNIDVAECFVILGAVDSTTLGNIWSYFDAQYGTPVTPLVQFGSNCGLWLRGDVGNSTTWTDQSATSANATWVGTPTATTLGPNGKAAWNVSSGQYAENTSHSIVPAGSSFSVFAVGKALTTFGGAIFCVRRTIEFNASIAVTTGGQTYYYTASANNDTVGSDLSATLQAVNGFIARWRYTGTGVPGFRLNRVTQASGVQTQILESGSVGYQVCQDSSAAQPWNGIIGEVFVITRAVSFGECAYAEGYIKNYWGI